MSLNKGYTQGVRNFITCRTPDDNWVTLQGSNADNLLSDSFVKGIRDGVNWDDGLKAMLKDATDTPPDWLVEGRGGIDNRKKLGYVPVSTSFNFIDMSQPMVFHRLMTTRLVESQLGKY